MHPTHVHSREQALIGPAVLPAKHVPPPWFLTTMTAYSVRQGAGLLHPATGQGFAAFRLRHAPAPFLPKEFKSGTLDGAPRNAVHTLRRVPLADSRTASLRPLPSCRFFATLLPEFAEANSKTKPSPPKR